MDIVSPMPLASFFRRTSDTVSQTLTFRTTVPAGAETEPLVRLRVRSLLGNATSTTVHLDSVMISGVRVQNAAPAHYRSRGINYAGGSPRLIYTPNLTTLTLAPNPVGDELSIIAEVREAAGVTVEITDVLGRKQMLHTGALEAPGQTTIRVPASHLASGVYLLSVRVGPEYVYRMISIIR